MTKPAGDPSNAPAPTPRPKTPALVRTSVAALALGIVGCGGGDAVPPQIVPPQAPPTDVTIPAPPQAPPPQIVPPQAPPPPQVAPPPPNQPNPKNPSSAPPNQR